MGGNLIEREPSDCLDVLVECARPIQRERGGRGRRAQEGGVKECTEEDPDGVDGRGGDADRERMVERALLDLAREVLEPGEVAVHNPAEERADAPETRDLLEGHAGEDLVPRIHREVVEGEGGVRVQRWGRERGADARAQLGAGEIGCGPDEVISLNVVRAHQGAEFGPLPVRIGDVEHERIAQLARLDVRVKRRLVGRAPKSDLGEKRPALGHGPVDATVSAVEELGGEGACGAGVDGMIAGAHVLLAAELALAPFYQHDGLRRAI